MSDTSIEVPSSPIPCLAMSHNKGGVGKSTLAQAISEFAAVAHHRRVLLLDWDGQLNTTTAYVGTDFIPGLGKLPVEHPQIKEEFEAAGDNAVALPFNIRSTITDIFDTREKYPVPYPTYFDEERCDGGLIDVVAGNQAAFKMILESTPVEMASSPFANLAQVSTPKLVEMLIHFVTLPEIAEDYDMVVIDPGPSESPLFTAALRAATHVVSPYSPENKAMEGVTGLVDSAQSVIARRRQGLDRKEPLHYIGMVPNQVRHNKEHVENIRKCRKEAGRYHLPEEIYIRDAIDISRLTKPVEQRPKPYSVAWMKETDSAYEDLSVFSKYVLEQMGVI